MADYEVVWMILTWPVRERERERERERQRDRDRERERGREDTPKSRAKHSFTWDRRR